MIVNLADPMPMTALDICRKYITIYKKGETVLYVKSLNAIYETMKLEL